MTDDQARFELAFGQCSIRGDTLRIERPDPETLGRKEVFRYGLVRNLEYRLLYTILRLGGLLVLSLVLAYLLMYVYLSNPAVAPLVLVLGLLGVLALGVPIERIYRQATSEREELRRELAREFQLQRPRVLSLADITDVTLKSASSHSDLTNGHLLLIHFHHDGDEATTYLGIPEFMPEELATAQAIFEDYGLAQPDPHNRGGNDGDIGS
jgi:hypothetical protein